MILIVGNEHRNVLTIRTKRHHWLPMWTDQADAEQVLIDLSLGKQWTPIDMGLSPEQVYRSITPKLKARYAGYIVDPGLANQHQVKEQDIPALPIQ